MPEGANLVDLIRSTKHDTIRITSKKIGVSRDVYDLARRLVTLKDRQVLSKEEEDLVDQAFATLEQKGRFKEAAKLVDGVLQRLWKNGTRTGEYKNEAQARPDKKIRSRFDRTIFTIGEICTNLEEVQIPQIYPRPEREKAVDVLTDSILALADLLRQIKRGYEHDRQD